MSMPTPSGAGGAPINRTLEAFIDKQEMRELRQAVQQDAAQQLQDDWRDNVSFAKRPQKKKTIKSRAKTITKTEFSKEQGDRLGPVQKLKNAADQFQKQNPELKSRVLVMLREYIKPGDSAEEILAKVLEFYDDVALADEALDFLLETTEGELHQKVLEAKKNLNSEFGREVRAGRNIGDVARESAEEGLGTPSSLRDLYRDITGNPRESTTLFQELSNKYSYQEMQKVIQFLLHSAGADLKSKGPSIPKGLLHNLVLETRALQAILGVYHFFKSRMKLIKKLFAKHGISVPDELTFESLAKIFMSLANDRYPSQDKILQSAKRLGIDDWIMAKIIVFSQLRDAIREVAMNQIYRSVQHRDELFQSLIAALEALEEELDELLEQEEDEEDEEDRGESFNEDEDF